MPKNTSQIKKKDNNVSVFHDKTIPKLLYDKKMLVNICKNHLPRYTMITVMTLSFRTDTSGQTEKTQIRLLPEGINAKLLPMGLNRQTMVSNGLS